VNRHKTVALAPIALDDMRGFCASEQPRLDENVEGTVWPLRGLIRSEDFAFRIGAAQSLKNICEQFAFRHAAALSRLAGSLGSIPESANILRMMLPWPSCLSEHEFGQLISKLRVLAFLDAGLWTNVTLMPT
jgi:hypothetical protein